MICRSKCPQKNWRFAQLPGLVDVYIAMERSTIFIGKTHDFDWAIFNSHGILIVISGYPYIYGLQELMDICRLHPPKTALRPFSIATLNYQNVYSMEPSSDRHLVIEVGTTMLPAWEVLQQDMKGEAGSLVCSVVPQVRKKLSW